MLYRSFPNLPLGPRMASKHSTTMWHIITVFWISVMSFAAVILCVSSHLVFGSVRVKCELWFLNCWFTGTRYLHEFFFKLRITVSEMHEMLRTASGASASGVNTDFWMVLLIQTCGNISWRWFVSRWFFYRSHKQNIDSSENHQGKLTKCHFGWQVRLLVWNLHIKF